MSEETPQQIVESNSLDEMMKLFEEMPFWKRWRKIRAGLRQPKESGDYKWARLQVLRLWAPTAGIVVPSLALLIATVVVALAPAKNTTVQVSIREEKVVEELKEVEPPPEPEIQPPEPTDVAQVNETFIPSTSKETSVGPDADFSPQPALLDSVAIIKSPVIMKGIFGSRSPGARGSALGRHGGSGVTEGAVLRALRWLKKNQEGDGSWNSTSGGGIGKMDAPAGLTGLALLTYLAHGETPASPEFGATVDKAIKWLLKRQREDGAWLNVQYEHLIATYAVCEAFSMIGMPSLKAAARKGMDVIIAGQNPSGGFDYSLTPGAPRNDTSIMGWAAQAMKAGKIAGVECPDLDNAMKKAIEGFKCNFQGDSASGGFGYDGPGKHGLTGAGILSHQLLGIGKSPETKGALAYLMATDQFDWNRAAEGDRWRMVYRWYYNTQARFHEGGECWKTWNKAFSVPMVKAQIVIPQAIQAPSGKMVDIGYWDVDNGKGGLVMDTTLCALMLQVYYRYLPTFQKPEEIAADTAAAEGGKKEDGTVKAKDLDIEVKM
ncbi:MAG: terpene cyclase/mutase family protein [Verrucomicrobiota bacterium]|nr:terpene cyclase/mutase family protein [Verrucomicrobiota bacterium]